MYRDAVDQATRNDIAAAAEAHHELGREYDGAVAESLVDRIGEEIDKRVDARLGQRGVPAARGGRGAELTPATRSSWAVPVILGLGSMGIAVGGAAVLLSVGSHLANASQVALIALIWIIIGVINVAYARRR